MGRRILVLGKKDFGAGLATSWLVAFPVKGKSSLLWSLTYQLLVWQRIETFDLYLEANVLSFAV